MKSIVVLIVLLVGYSFFASAQLNWYNKDLATDSVFGISTDKAYKELLKSKTSRKVIVAVIDSGIDTAHEDLRSVIWTDVKTGIHGWNYIGQETGQEDVTKLVGNRKGFYDSLSYSLVPEIYRVDYQQYRKLKPALSEKIRALKDFIVSLEHAREVTDAIVKKIGKANPEITDFKNYRSTDEEEQKMIAQILDRFTFYDSWDKLQFSEIDYLIRLAQYHLKHGLNIENKEKDTARGDANVYPDAVGLMIMASATPMHGTQVASVIGAKRGNGKGIDGVADNIEIMMLKVNGNIRELRDRNLAMAIKFAVDNGAKIINMSFGKPYSWDKSSVDNAISYGEARDVLFIHAAGNNNDNLDVVPNYPNPNDRSVWIEVGASGIKDDKSLVAPFSNYGAGSVDVFAPGVQMYTCIPGSKYETASGTSLAAPIVTGLAAIIRGYHPGLTAKQIKEIIIKTVVKRDILKDKCISGGVVNAFDALKLAAVFK